MKYYPIFLNLQGRRCLVFGAGRVAARKIARLLECEARIVVVAPEATGEVARWAEEGLIEWIKRQGSIEDLDGGAEDGKPALVFLCADNPAFHRTMAKACRERGLAVNTADSPGECSFILPSVVERGALQIAISTSGQCPGLARKLREELDKSIDPAYEVFLRIVGEIRRANIENRVPAAERRRQINLLLDGLVFEAIQCGGEKAGREEAKRLLSREAGESAE